MTETPKITPEILKVLVGWKESCADLGEASERLQSAQIEFGYRQVCEQGWRQEMIRLLEQEVERSKTPDDNEAERLDRYRRLGISDTPHNRLF